MRTNIFIFLFFSSLLISCGKTSISTESDNDSICNLLTQRNFTFDSIKCISSSKSLLDIKSPSLSGSFNVSYNYYRDSIFRASVFLKFPPIRAAQFCIYDEKVQVSSNFLDSLVSIYLPYNSMSFLDCILMAVPPDFNYLSSNRLLDDLNYSYTDSLLSVSCSIYSYSCLFDFNKDNTLRHINLFDSRFNIDVNYSDYRILAGIHFPTQLDIYCNNHTQVSLTTKNPIFETYD